MNVTEVKAMTRATEIFLMTEIFAGSEIDLRDVELISQILAAGDRRKAISMSNRNLRQLANGRTLTVAFNITADCPSDIQLHEFVETSVTNELELYTRHIKEDFMLGAPEDAYFHVVAHESRSSVACFGSANGKIASRLNWPLDAQWGAVVDQPSCDLHVKIVELL